MILRTFLSLLLLAGLAHSQTAEDTSSLERSIVTIETNVEGYDYTQPWTRASVTARKSGVVIDSQLILTTAEQLNDLLLIRLQKGGRGRWYTGELVWKDYHANLALITCTDESFWDGLRRVSFVRNLPLEGDARLLRWRPGSLESRKVEISRPMVRTGKLTFIDVMHLEVNTDVRGIGWSEPVMNGSRLIGLMAEQTGSGGLVIPAPFIERILEAREDGDYAGLGFFNFYWQRAENPATLKALQRDTTDQGVIVIKSLARTDEESILEPQDVILEIDGQVIGPEGDYQDEEYGRMMLEALATRNAWAGDEIPMKIWRDGELMEISYKLPKAEFTDEAIPDQTFDRPPQYLIAGGLVFQPLDLPYLRNWGSNWERSAPFRLAYLKQSAPEDEREAIVVLSMVLPDPYNLGYQSTNNQIVHEINGIPIVRLVDVERALEQPQDGFHIVTFAEGHTPARIILDAEQLDTATGRIIQRYGIENDRYIARSEDE